MPPPAGGRWDVFHGDADGILSLRILRGAEPLESSLLTGLKRDIGLLAGLAHLRDAQVTVLDLSLEANLPACEQLLAQGCRLRWLDHHRPGTIPSSPLLRADIDPSPDTCTATLALSACGSDRDRAWAVAAAFGDNLRDRAMSLGAGLDGGELEALREVGGMLNYNGYGESAADQCARPADLYRETLAHANPFDFRNRSPLYLAIREQYRRDEADLLRAAVLHRDAAGACLLLPEGRAGRRLSGDFANRLAREEPLAAHAVLTRLSGGGLRVSIRAPLGRPVGADILAARFPSGGGRPRAAGINRLPEERLPDFIALFKETFPTPC